MPPRRQGLEFPNQPRRESRSSRAALRVSPLGQPPTALMTGTAAELGAAGVGVTVLGVAVADVALPAVALGVRWRRMWLATAHSRSSRSEERRVGKERKMRWTTC